MKFIRFVLSLAHTKPALHKLVEAKAIVAAPTAMRALPS
jgi:hypothetical protein